MSVHRATAAADALLDAIRMADPGRIAAAVAAGADPNAPLSAKHGIMDGEPALFHAVFGMKQARLAGRTIAALCAAGADPNIRSTRGFPLAVMAIDASPEHLDALLAAGADANIAVDGRSLAGRVGARRCAPMLATVFEHGAAWFPTPADAWTSTAICRASIDTRTAIQRRCARGRRRLGWLWRSWAVASGGHRPRSAGIAPADRSWLMAGIASAAAPATTLRLLAWAQGLPACTE